MGDILHTHYLATSQWLVSPLTWSPPSPPARPSASLLPSRSLPVRHGSEPLPQTGTRLAAQCVATLAKSTAAAEGSVSRRTQCISQKFYGYEIGVDLTRRGAVRSNYFEMSYLVSGLKSSRNSLCDPISHDKTSFSMNFQDKSHEFHGLRFYFSHSSTCVSFGSSGYP